MLPEVSEALIAFNDEVAARFQNFEMRSDDERKQLIEVLGVERRVGDRFRTTFQTEEGQAVLRNIARDAGFFRALPITNGDFDPYELAADAGARMLYLRIVRWIAIGHYRKEDEDAQVA